MLRDEQRTPDVFEPIMEKKDCRIKILGATKHNWKPKEATGVTEETNAMKLELSIEDDDAVTENKDAKARKRIDDYINLAPHPYVDKSGEKQMLRPSKVYQLQRALGFDPVFVGDAGEPVPPRITRTGAKACPVGCHERLNPDFLDAYFDSNDEPKFGSWVDKDVIAHVGVDPGTEEFSPSNKVRSYKAPVGV